MNLNVLLLNKKKCLVSFIQILNVFCVLGIQSSHEKYTLAVFFHLIYWKHPDAAIRMWHCKLLKLIQGFIFSFIFQFEFFFFSFLVSVKAPKQNKEKVVQL